MKKMFSLITAMALVITMIPFQSSFAATADTKVKVSDKVWVGNQEAQHGALITLEEEEKTSWRADDTYVLRLPDGVTWNKYTRINGRLVKEADIDGRDLSVKLLSSDNIDKLVIDPYFNIERNVEKGDLRLLFQRGDVAEADRSIVIAEVKDYGAKISVSKIESFNYGDLQPREVVLTLEEFVSGSLLQQTGYELAIDNATIVDDKNFTVRTVEGDRKLTTKLEDKYINFSVENGTGKGKWQLKFNIIPNKDFAGDITLKLTGREIEDNITIATVEQKLAAINGTPTNIALGHQNQEIASIEITETSAGAILEGVHAIVVDPVYKGLNFTDGSLEVVEGNVEVKNFNYKDGIIKFEVTNISSRPSKIVINGLKVTIDQFGYVGDYKGNVVLNYGKSNETKLGEIVLFNATTGTPIEGTAKFVGQFTIGKPDFTIITSGISRTETFDSAPYIQDNRTMLSVAAAGIALDAKVSYDHPTRTVTVESEGKTAVLKIGSNVLTVDGQEILMDTAATITNSRTFIPLKYLADVFGAEVLWDQNTKTVSLMKN